MKQYTDKEIKEIAVEKLGFHPDGDSAHYFAAGFKYAVSEANKENRDLWERTDCEDCEGTGVRHAGQDAGFKMFCRTCSGEGKRFISVEN